MVVAKEISMHAAAAKVLSELEGKTNLLSTVGRTFLLFS